MLTFLAMIHFFVCLFLILFVLLQDSKGGALGVFGGGGSSNTFLGATGASSFLSKATKTLAIVFAIGCLALSYLSTRKGTSVLDQAIPAASIPLTAPAAEGTKVAPGPAAKATEAPSAAPTEKAAAPAPKVESAPKADGKAPAQ